MNKTVGGIGSQDVGAIVAHTVWVEFMNGHSDVGGVLIPDKVSYKLNVTEASITEEDAEVVSRKLRHSDDSYGSVVDTVNSPGSIIFKFTTDTINALIRSLMARNQVVSDSVTVDADFDFKTIARKNFHLPLGYMNVTNLAIEAVPVPDSLEVYGIEFKSVGDASVEVKIESGSANSVTSSLVETVNNIVITFDAADHPSASAINALILAENFMFVTTTVTNSETLFNTVMDSTALTGGIKSDAISVTDFNITDAVKGYIYLKSEYEMPAEAESLAVKITGNYVSYAKSVINNGINKDIECKVIFDGVNRVDRKKQCIVIEKAKLSIDSDDIALISEEHTSIEMAVTPQGGFYYEYYK